MDATSIIPTFLHRESLHQFFNTATPDERLQARAHVKKFVATERGKRDREIAAAEAELPKVRKAIADAAAALTVAQAAERGVVDRIGRAQQAFNTTAGVLEQRLDDYDPTHKNGEVRA